MNIAFIGGHLTPALAVLDYVLENTDHRRIFIGRTTVQASGKPSVEPAALLERKVPFFACESPRWRGASLESVVAIFSIIAAARVARTILKREQVEVVLGFGGYIQVPVALAALSLRIPICIHEQTRHIGIANQLVATFANLIGLAYPLNLPKRLKKKSVVVGNFVRAGILKEYPQPAWYQPSNKPLLLIVGGSQGSSVINHLVWDTIDALTNKFHVVHQLGMSSPQEKPSSKAQDVFATLSSEQQVNYQARAWLSEPELAWLLHHAHLQVSRAGANTVTESLFFQIPTLYIPLPHARFNGQWHNATEVAKKGGALVLEQPNATPALFFAAIEQLFDQRSKILHQLQKMSIEPEKAAAVWWRFVEQKIAELERK